MVDVSYESLQSKIETQKSQITQQRTIGQRNIESLKRVHPRTKPGVYFGQVKPQLESIQSRLGELKKAETELSKQEQLLAEKKAEGWKIRETEEGKYEFYKTTQVPGTGVGAPRGDFTIRITWRDYRTKPEGEKKTVRGSASNLESMEQQIRDRGGAILEIESLGGGRHLKTPETRTTTGGSFILWEAPAPPSIKEPIKTKKEIEIYTSVYEKIPDISSLKKRFKTPTEFAEARGATITYQPFYEMSPEIRFLMEYADPIEKAKLKKAFEAGPVTAPEGFIGPIQQPIYPAIKKSFESLTESEKKSYAERFKVEYVTAPTTSFSELVTARYGAERLDIYAAKHIQDWGFPALIAGTQTLTGFDKKAWERLHEQYAAEILGSTQRTGESFADYSARFWLSPQAILNVYLPIVTIGTSYAIKPYLIGLKTIQPASKIFPVTSRIAYYGSKYHKILAAGTIGTIGGITAYQVATQPTAAPLIIGRTAAAFGKMYGGYQVGGKLYTTTHAKLIQESYWTGTAYEQNIAEALRRQSVIDSQYKRFEFGTPSARYTAMIRPSWQKVPYVPKTPVQLHTMTLGIRDPEVPYKGFFIKKPRVSSRDFAVYETSPVTVKVRGKDYTFNVFSGEVSIKETTRRVVGFGSGRYVGDIADDVMAARMYGYSISDGVRPTIVRGTALSKTYYGGETKWVGDKIKFFTTGKESDITIGFSFGRLRGMEAFDVSNVVKPSIKAKSYFGDPGRFDYQLPPKLIDDVIMPGGIQMEAGLKIELKSFFGPQIKPVKYVDIGAYDIGMQISSYWKGVAPISDIPAAASIRETRPISISDSIQKLGMIPLVKTIQANIPITTSKQISVPLTRVKQDQFTLAHSISKTIVSSISAQENISVSMTKQLQQQLQLTQLKQVSLTVPVTTPSLFVIPRWLHTPYMIKPPEPTITKPPPPMPFISGILPDADPYKIFGAVPKQGYHAEVRERHYVKRKLVREGKFVKIGERPLSYINAKALMGMALDRSAAASGRVVPTNAMAQEPLIDLKPFENIAHKFYMKDNVFIEKTKHRIDTHGEVKGISALGWYTERAKKAERKRHVVSRKPVKGFDAMFDIGMDDMLIDMNKMFKGVFDFGFR